MSRPILFRAWTGHTMMYQDNQYLGSFIRRVVTRIMLDNGMDEPREHESYLPKGKTIGDYLLQYTEHQDKNQRKIYDGDFLANEWGKYRVCWEDGTPVVFSEDGKFIYLNDFGCDRTEVIGNRYENPELLAFFSNNK